MLGEVNLPQALSFKATTMNLMDAVGTAGGIRQETADGEALYVIRGAEDMMTEPAKVFQLNAKSPTAFALAKHFPLQPQDVVFVGAVSDKERARYFKTADIYCSPATGRESFGIVLAEAMAAGTPIVASDIAGYSGVITSGREGLLVKPKTDEDLAVAIATLLRAPALRALMGANGRQRVEQFRWERVAARVQDYYKTVLDDRLAVRSA